MCLHHQVCRHDVGWALCGSSQISDLQTLDICQALQLWATRLCKVGQGSQTHGPTPPLAERDFHLNIMSILHSLSSD